jgi:hypothetical protein
VGYRWLAILCRYGHLKNTISILCHGSSLTVPVVKVANEVCSKSIRSPFSIYNVAVVLDVEAQLLKSLWQMSILELRPDRTEGAYPRELLYATFRVIDRLHPLLGFLVAAAKGVFEGFEVRIELDDACNELVSQLDYAKSRCRAHQCHRWQPFQLGSRRWSFLRRY